jgi:hypothetical protein
MKLEKTDVKKFLPVTLVILVFIAVGTLALATSDKNDSTQNTRATTGAKKFSPPQACSIFTLDNAKKLLGDSTKATEIPAASASNDDIEVTQCFYQEPSGQHQANILVRGAKTDKGKAGNVDYFKGSTKPANVQDVNGYGEAAFWNPEFGQLHILKNGNWYILSFGPLAPSERKLDDVRTLADTLINRL